jgi:hypothetical protein
MKIALFCLEASRDDFSHMRVRFALHSDADGGFRDISGRGLTAKGAVPVAALFYCALAGCDRGTVLQAQSSSWSPIEPGIAGSHFSSYDLDKPPPPRLF